MPENQETERRGDDIPGDGKSSCRQDMCRGFFETCVFLSICSQEHGFAICCLVTVLPPFTSSHTRITSAAVGQGSGLSRMVCLGSCKSEGRVSLEAQQGRIHSQACVHVGRT